MINLQPIEHLMWVASKSLLTSLIYTPASVIAVTAGLALAARGVKSLVMAHCYPPKPLELDPVVGLDCEPIAGAFPATLEEVGEVVGPNDPLPEDTRCRKAGRAIGAMIRREMGYPSYTNANRVVAAQRIESYRKKEYPSLRVQHMEAFAAHALYWVFTPTRVEVQMHTQLHTAAGVELRAVPAGSYDYSASALLRALPTSLGNNSLVRATARWFNLVPHIGPGFQ